MSHEVDTWAAAAVGAIAGGAAVALLVAVAAVRADRLVERPPAVEDEEHAKAMCLDWWDSYADTIGDRWAVAVEEDVWEGNRFVQRFSVGIGWHDDERGGKKDCILGIGSSWEDAFCNAIFRGAGPRTGGEADSQKAKAFLKAIGK